MKLFLQQYKLVNLSVCKADRVCGEVQFHVFCFHKLVLKCNKVAATFQENSFSR